MIPMNNMLYKIQELSMIQVHMDQPPRYITKLAWHGIHDEDTNTNIKSAMRLDKQNDMDEQHDMTATKQP